jgi:hypothetical protein
MCRLEKNMHMYMRLSGGGKKGADRVVERQLRERRERERGVGGISYLFGMLAAVVEDRKNFDLFALCCC